MQVETTMVLQIGTSAHPKGTILDLSDADAREMIRAHRATEYHKPATEAPIALTT